MEPSAAGIEEEGRAAESSQSGILARLPWLAPYLSCVFFAVMAVCVRLLSELPTAEVMFFRCAIPVGLILPWVLTQGRASFGLALRHRGALITRGLAGTVSLYFYLLSVRSIPLSDATVATATSPLWAALAARWALGETLQPQLVWAFPLSFAGVVLMAGCRASGQLSGYAAGLLSAALMGGAYAVVRKLRDLPSEWIVLAFTGLAGLASLPMAWLHYQEPTWQEWRLILGMGLSGAAGQWFMTVGYRYNRAATAASLGLATVAVTALLAWGLLGESLVGWQWLGVAMVMIGTLGATRL